MKSNQKEINAGVWLPPKYPDILASIAKEVAGCLSEVAPDMEMQDVYTVALSAAECVRAQHQGTLEYIPKGMSYMASIRDEKIWKEFNGNNYDELAAKNDMSSMRVRQICSFMRAQDTARRQAGLFG